MQSVAAIQQKQEPVVPGSKNNQAQGYTIMDIPQQKPIDWTQLTPHNTM